MSDLSYHYLQGQRSFGKNLDIAIKFPAVTATGSNGIYSAASGGVSTFTDTTAAAFTAAMVGQTITITGSIHAVNNGTFIVTAYTSGTVISISNPYGVVDTAVDVWSVVPNPTIVQGDTSNTYTTVQRCGTGLYTVTTTDGFPVCDGFLADVQPSTAAGSWHLEMGQPVQNIAQFHPFFANQVAVGLNSWTLPFTAYDGTTATDLVPTTVTGTHGAPTTPTTTTQGWAYFQDTTAASFTPAMVGAPITISSGVAANQGTFTVLAFINSTEIIISNGAAITATGLSWSIAKQAMVNMSIMMNNGPSPLNSGNGSQA